MAQDQALRDTIGDMLATERAKRVRGARIMGASVAKGLDERSTVADILRTPQEYEAIGTRPAPGLDAKWALEFKRRVAGDLADYVAAMQDEKRTPEDIFKYANQVNDQIVDLAKTFLTSNVGARGKAAAARIGALTDLGESYIDALGKEIGPAPGGSLSRQIYGAIRQRIAGLNTEGRPWDSATVLELANMFHDASIPDRDKARMFSWLAAETANRLPNEPPLIDQLVNAANNKDAQAAAALRMYQGLGQQIQDASRELASQVGQIVGVTTERILKEHPGMGTKELSEFFRHITPVLEGRAASVQAAFMNAETALDQLASKLPEGAEDAPIEQLQDLDALIDVLWKGQDDLDTTGTIKEVRSRLKKDEDYRGWAESEGLDPDLDSTVRFAINRYRKEGKNKEKENRAKIRAKKAGERQAPPASAQAAGDGLGESVELGDASTAPYTTEELMGGEPFRRKGGKVIPSSDPNQPFKDKSPGDIAADKAEAEAFEIPSDEDAADLHYLDEPRVWLVEGVDGEPVVAAWDPSQRAVVYGGTLVQQAEDTLNALFDANPDAFNEARDLLWAEQKRALATISVHRDIVGTARTPAAPAGTLTKEQKEEEIAVAKNIKDRPMFSEATLTMRDPQNSKGRAAIARAAKEAGRVEEPPEERGKWLKRLLRNRRKKRESEIDDTSGTPGAAG